MHHTEECIHGVAGSVPCCACDAETIRSLRAAVEPLEQMVRELKREEQRLRLELSAAHTRIAAYERQERAA